MSEIKVKIKQDDYNFQVVNNSNAQEAENKKLFLNYIDEEMQDNYFTFTDTESDADDVAEISRDYFRTQIGLEKTDEGFLKVKVQSWGSEALDGLNKANDCLTRIISNYYPDIKLYSDEYNKLMGEICRVNGIEDPNNIRTGAEITLPVPVRDPENNSIMGFFSPKVTEGYVEPVADDAADDVTVDDTLDDTTVDSDDDNNTLDDNSDDTEGTKVEFKNKSGLIDREEDDFYEVEVQAWGSQALEGLKNANDCLSRIILNYYPDIKLLSDDYNKLLNEICKINDIKNPNYIRTGTHIILPFLKKDENGNIVGFESPEVENKEVEPSSGGDDQRHYELLLNKLETKYNNGDLSEGMYFVMKSLIEQFSSQIASGDFDCFTLDNNDVYTWKQLSTTWMFTKTDSQGNISAEYIYENSGALSQKTTVLDDGTIEIITYNGSEVEKVERTFPDGRTEVEDYSDKDYVIDKNNYGSLTGKMPTVSMI